ncbi:MAG: hypothetical protein VX913_06445 [Planctomycetota bacterium]|nr:hypothetical protein [Planctomycetota bacterium]
MKTKIALVLVALLIVPGLALAQIETAADKKKQEDPGSAWISTLVAKMTETDESVVRSVDRAIVSMGEKALPSLEKASKAEGETGERAKRLIEQIKNPRGRRGGERGGRGGERGGRGGDRGGRGGRGGFGGFGRDPFEGIELKAEQKTKVEAIQEKQNEERRELFEAMRNGEIDRSEIRDAMTELQENMNSAVKKVLTEEQFKKFTENSSGGRGGRGGRGRGGDG